MGEVVRMVLVDLVEEDLMFQGDNIDKLLEKGGFQTKYVSEIESDPVGVFTKCHEVLNDIGIDKPTKEDCSALRYVCECVSRRAGFMVSAGITALLKKMNYKDVVVAVDGSVFRFHPHFPNIVKSRIAQLMGTEYQGFSRFTIRQNCNMKLINSNVKYFQFELMLSTDGSGRGAALVAAVLEGQCAI